MVRTRRSPRLLSLTAAIALGVGAVGCAADEEGPLKLPDESAAQDAASGDQPDDDDDGGDTDAEAGDDSGDDDSEGRAAQDGFDDTDADTDTEIETFILEAMDAYDVAWSTGDTAGWEALYVDTCDKCLQGTQYIERIYAGGGSIEGGEFTDSTPQVVGRQGEYIQVNVQTTTTAYEISGDEAASESETQAVERFAVTETADGWRIADWS